VQFKGKINEAIVEEIGEDVSSCYGQECLIVINHQSTGDVPVLMGAFLNKADVIPNMMWLMDRVFKFTNFGLVSLAHGDFFIRSGKNVRQSELDSLTRHLIEVYSRKRRKWLILFPEGGFLHKRKATSQKYAKANNLPDLERVSLPRLGAMHTIIQTLNPTITEAQSNHSLHNSNHKSESNAVNSIHHHKVFEDGLEKKDTCLKWVIDITIAYPKAEPLGLLTLCTGSRQPCKTVLHYRRYPIEEVPRALDAMTKWLYDRWVEKEHMLDEFYESGKFPEVKTTDDCKLLSEPKPVVLDNLWLFVLHIFFITSTLCHCYMLCSLISLIW